MCNEYIMLGSDPFLITFKNHNEGINHRQNP